MKLDLLVYFDILPVILLFLCSLMNSSPQNIENIKTSEKYKLCKSIESTIQLTKPVMILPFHFREVVLLYKLTRSRLTLDMLNAGSPSGSYQATQTWLQSLPKINANVPDGSDLISVFDNNQVLTKTVANFM